MACLRTALVICIAVVCASSDLHAGIILQVTAFNPSDQDEQKVAIRSKLPQGIRPDHVINREALEADGLLVKYDVKLALYVLSGELTLKPKQGRKIEVELEDIWVVEEDFLSRAETYARNRLEQLKESSYEETGSLLSEQIRESLQKLGDRQKGAMSARPIEHIRIYELNRKLLAQIKEDIQHLDHFVLATGQDIGEELMGETRRRPDPRDDETIPGRDYGTAVFSYTMENTSALERILSFKQSLPLEIKVEDVLDAGELELGYDEADRVVTVYKQDIVFGPEETKTFQVVVRDKWDVNDVRVSNLMVRVTNVLAVVVDQGNLATLEEFLHHTQEQLVDILETEGPEEMNDAYVAFYRDEGDTLDRIEKRIIGLEEMMQPIPEQQPDILKEAHDVFKTQAPDRKTTWIIIYIILGFLAVVSILFFLRWYGKGQDEEIADKAA
ncbi:MAG TPA: hypothetical protein DIC52_22540 [Candidatus Latescibacteria bacterium]|nr:hypothetical protein [Candidatus Latescibacterota bacterium]|tara:strand:- start:1813 stop:3138 length:1326 start_codon:yes stop_codon:yes gene_type:complete